MFERFTESAAEAVRQSQEQARLLGHNQIGTEHLLLGLIQDSESVAARALIGMQISPEMVCDQLMTTVSPGRHLMPGHIPFAKQTQRALGLALSEALHLGHNYIGAEHLLLGLVRERKSTAARALAILGANLDRTRLQVLYELRETA